MVTFFFCARNNLAEGGAELQRYVSYVRGAVTNSSMSVKHSAEKEGSLLLCLICIAFLKLCIQVFMSSSFNMMKSTVTNYRSVPLTWFLIFYSAAANSFVQFQKAASGQVSRDIFCIVIKVAKLNYTAHFL